MSGEDSEYRRERGDQTPQPNERKSGRLNQRCPGFNPHLRQLIHVGYKIAAELGDRYLGMLKTCEATIAKNVTENLYERHLKPLFLEK